MVNDGKITNYEFQHFHLSFTAINEDINRQHGKDMHFIVIVCLVHTF